VKALAKKKKQARKNCLESHLNWLEQVICEVCDVGENVCKELLTALDAIADEVCATVNAVHQSNRV